MKDVVIGAITNYKWNHINPWVNSLEDSGFSGEKVMICYNIPYKTVDELKKRNYTIIVFGKDDEHQTYAYNFNFSIVVERFFHMWLMMKKRKKEFRYVIATDVKDVIFQSNPSVWLENNIGDKKINVACESLKYKDEPWGNNNIRKAFGNVLGDHLQDNLIFNAGTLSGDFDTMCDLFLNISLLCNGIPHYVEGGGGPDQAALNILLNMEPYKSITKFSMSEDGWAAQLGTTGTQVRDKFADKLVERPPIFYNDKICTSDCVPHVLVHQYDRVPELKKYFLEKYK